MAAGLRIPPLRRLLGAAAQQKWMLRATWWTLRASMWMLRATWWTLRAIMWMLRATWWTLRAVMWMLRATWWILSGCAYRCRTYQIAHSMPAGMQEVFEGAFG
eukprot:9050172-Pyramimonas_sp.AAC.1